MDVYTATEAITTNGYAIRVSCFALRASGNARQQSEERYRSEDEGNML